MDKSEIVLYQQDSIITSVEVRLKFDALPMPEVSTAEVRNIKHGRGFSRRVIDWLNQKKLMGEYRNIDKGWDIAFNNRSVRNVMSHGAMDGKVALLEYAPDLIENGVYLTTTIKNSDGVYREAALKEIKDRTLSKSHIFAAKADIDGQKSTVGIVVKEDSNGRRYYDHAIKIGDQEVSGGANQRASGQSSDPQSTISNIVQKHLAVNSQIS